MFLHDDFWVLPWGTISLCIFCIYVLFISMSLESLFITIKGMFLLLYFFGNLRILTVDKDIFVSSPLIRVICVCIVFRN